MTTKNKSVALPSTLTALLTDPVAVVRSLPVIEPAQVAAVPDSYRPLDPDLKKKFAKLPATQRAEADDSLGEIAANDEQLHIDLGPFAPLAGQAGAILDRFRVTRAASRRAEALAVYCADQEDIASHDALTLVLQVQGDLARAAERNPSIVARYPELFALAEQRTAAVINGIANAKANDAAVAAAKAQATKPANATGSEPTPVHSVQDLMAALKST